MEAGVFMHRRCGVYTIGVSPCWVGKGHTMMSSRSLCTHSVWNSDTRLQLRSRAHLCTVLPMQDVALCVVDAGFPHYAATHAGANLTASWNSRVEGSMRNFTLAQECETSALVYATRSKRKRTSHAANAPIEATTQEHQQWHGNRNNAAIRIAQANTARAPARGGLLMCEQECAPARCARRRKDANIRQRLSVDHCLDTSGLKWPQVWWHPASCRSVWSVGENIRSSIKASRCNA